MPSKSLSTKIQRLEGNKDPQSGKWSKTAVFEPPEEEILKTRGRLFAVLDISAPQSFDFTLAERMVFDTLSEKYFSELEGSPLSNLEKALLEARHQLVSLAASSKKGQGELDFNLVAAVLWGQVLYLARMGSVATYIFREGNLKKVDLGEEKTLTTASGLVKPEDVIILGSKEFKTHFPEDQLLASLDSLDKLIRDLPDSSGIAALVLKIELLKDLRPGEQVLLVPPVRERFGGVLGVFINVKEKLSVAVRNLSERVKKPSVPIYLRGQQPPQPRPTRRHSPRLKSSWIVILLILLFSGSVAFTIFRHRKKTIKDEVSTIITETEDRLQEAEGQLDWNNARAQEIAEEVIQDLRRAIVYGEDKDKLAEYIGRAQAILDKANRTTRFNNPSLVYDFSLQSSDLSPKSISGAPGSIFVPAPEMQTIFQLDISESPVKVEKAVSEEVSGFNHLAVSPSFLWIVGEGLSVVDRSDFSLQRDVLETEFTWSSVVSIASYEAFGENLYLLTPAENQIFKISYLEGDFSNPTSWLVEETNLSEAVDFAIDGEIYILFKDGTVSKFLQGEKEDFGLLYEDFVEPTATYTDDNLDYIYILDRGKKGVIVFTKEGLYQSQYLYDGEDPVWEDVRDLWVDSETETIYILAGAKVFEVGL